MGVRLLILVVLAGGLAVYFAAKKPTQVIEEDPDINIMTTEGTTGDLATTRTVQTLVADQPIGGQEPEAEPEFDVKVEVDTSAGKNRLYFTVSEVHGYYVDTFRLQVWWVEEGVTGPDDSPLTMEVYLNNYKKANETLRTCVEVVPAELDNVGGDIGKSENWDVELIHYGRAREKNPDKFPVVSDVGQCH